MISCIVIKQSKVMNKDSKNLLKTIFHADRLEMSEFKNGVVLIFIHEVEKLKVWQVVLNLEAEQIPVGFGFGNQKDAAKKEALDRLELISKMKIHKKTWPIV